MDKKLIKQIIKQSKHQELVLVGSKFFDWVETISFFLHIIALVLGILTITGVFVSENSHLTHYLEILTLIVITLIILEFLFMPSLEKSALKGILWDLWGTNDIPTSVKFPTAVDVSTDFGTITKHFESTQMERTTIEFMRVHPWSRRRLVIYQTSPITQKKFKKYADEDGQFSYYFIPIYIIVDIERKIIKFQGKLNFVRDIERHELPEKRLTFQFDIKHKKVTWSGIFPHFPAYGEWIWNKKLTSRLYSTKLKEKKLNKKIKEEFKEINKPKDKKLDNEQDTGNKSRRQATNKK